jgi:hypothetical protein
LGQKNLQTLNQTLANTLDMELSLDESCAEWNLFYFTLTFTQKGQSSKNYSQQLTDVSQKTLPLPKILSRLRVESLFSSNKMTF